MKLARILVFLPLAMVLLTPVHATTPVLLSGGIGISGPTVIESRTADGNTFFTVVAQVEFTGGVAGTATTTNSFIENATGFATVRVSGTFTGTVSGSSIGTARMLATFTGMFVPGMLCNEQGQMTLGSGTQGLAGLHGQGTFSQLDCSSISYSVEVHFDP